MSYEVKLTPEKVVLVFNSETSDSIPVLRQESYPNGETWTKKQAQAWADTYAKFLEDPRNPMPGNSPELPAFEYVEPLPVELDISDVQVTAEEAS